MIWFCRDTVDTPVGPAFTVDQFMLLQVAEMFGNLYLRFLENFLHVTDTQWTILKQVQNPEPRGVAEAFIDGDRSHGINIL